MIRNFRNGIDSATAYSHTGSGCTTGKFWGENIPGTPAISMNFADTRAIGWDKYGRIINMKMVASGGNNPANFEYKYGYDPNGNRIYAHITQNGHINDESYLYGGWHAQAIRAGMFSVASSSRASWSLMRMELNSIPTASTSTAWTTLTSMWHSTTASPARCTSH